MKLSEVPAFSVGFDSRRYVKKKDQYKKKLRRGLLMLLARTTPEITSLSTYLTQGYGVMIPTCF
jgi:hypothetical protein